MKPCWDDRAREHIAKHGITTDEVDFVLARVRRPFPNDIGHGKWLVRGKTSVGRWIQVIYVYRRIDTLEWDLLDWKSRETLQDERSDEVVYVIHARDVTESEKRTVRRRVE